MVQHIRKKHPEFAQLANSIQAPLATTVINSTPAVIATDGTTTEAVVVRVPTNLRQPYAYTHTLTMHESNLMLLYMVSPYFSFIP